jgi:hypothetical protein
MMGILAADKWTTYLGVAHFFLLKVRAGPFFSFSSLFSSRTTKQNSVQIPQATEVALCE